MSIGRAFTRAIRRTSVTRLVCVATALAIATTGCTSLRPVPVVNPETAPQHEAFSLEPGDEVRITLRDGRQVQVTVEALEPAAIIARDGTRYDLADIVTVERREFSGTKTAFLVVGALGVAGFFLLLSYASAIVPVG